MPVKFLVLSHKETYLDPDSPSGYATTGGFPFQMQALSELFAQTTLLLPIRQPVVRNSIALSGIKPLAGHNLRVIPLPEPAGSDLRRKIAMLTWLPQNLPKIWQEIARADAVHAPVPGDLGFIGILVALFQRKPIFIRHCGTWGEPVTLADHILFWLLERIAGGRNVILATGGADIPPSKKNPNIHWIFSTTLTEGELAKMRAVPSPSLCVRASPFGGAGRSHRGGEPLRLVTVCRLTEAKNTQAILRALPSILSQNPDTRLDVVGDGPARPGLETLARDLGVDGQVTFHGNLAHADVLQVLSQSHLFVFPTRHREGFPKAVLEALAAGLPIVATGVSVIPDLIKDCGVILPNPGPEAVAQAVNRLAANPAQMAEMSARARQRAQEYSLETWRDRIGEHLQSVWGPLTRNPR